MARKIDNPPSADVLMDSMRAIGYTFNAAAADIVDNSISANALHVKILVSPSPSNIYLAFLDDGEGMSSDDLKAAMKYGSRSKCEERKANDLGRFGLGLKSASLSQCTELIVASKKDGVISADSWNLRVVQATKNWTLLELEEKEIEDLPCINQLKEQSQGTLVIWRDFDVIRQINNGQEYNGLTDNVNDACDFLGLVFHRYLLDRKLEISVNETPIEGIDPFLESNKKTEIGKPNDITIKDEKGIDQHITVTTYLLPYLKDLTETDKKKLGGVARINTMQGFYVYRNNRLIIYGTWFRMSYRNELAKYARIKVDIPSALDGIWKIDIKKQSAELPPIIKRQLQKCVENANFSSRRKNEHRLTLKTDDENAIWQKNLTREKRAVYRINRDSPVIRQIMQSVEPSDTSKINLLLDSIEKSIPFHDMYTDEANDNIEVELSEEDKMILAGNAIFLIKEKEKIAPIAEKDAVAAIMSIDPFRKYQDLEEIILRELKNG
jgi:hypothetical protein